MRYLPWIFLFLAFLFGCSSLGEKTAPEFEGFTLQDHIQQDQTQTMRYSQGDAILRLTMTNAQSAQVAQSMILTNIALLDSMFDETYSAYPGMISDEIACDDRFVAQKKQVVVDGIPVTYYEAYLSDRLKYGTCNADSAVYRSAIIWHYCPGSGTVWQFEYIMPLSSFSDTAIGYLADHLC